MTKNLCAAVALAAFSAIGGGVAAHEGHDHKIMGTVSMIHENHLEVKGTDGKVSTITLNDKTKVLRGTAKANVADIQVGERIVVTATQTKGKDRKESWIAKEIRLGSAVQSGK